MAGGVVVTKDRIKAGLRGLGLKEGDMVMVHASVSSFGHVEGGGEALIDALLETVGPEGTVMMPTFTNRQESVFDAASTPSADWIGQIPERFRLREGVLRSRNPYHPVAAYGAQAERLLQDHEKASSPCGEGTPFSRLIDSDGYVLLLGVDQDRNTLLHTVEASLDLPYLFHLEMRYLDENGQERTASLDHCPYDFVRQLGGHRGGVLGFDKLFREAEAMKVGKIGQAVVRLMEARGIVKVMRDVLEKDPAAALCDNENCIDCMRARGEIKKARFLREDFRLSAATWEISSDIDEVMDVLEGEGIISLEIGLESLMQSPVQGKEIRGKLDRRGFTVSVLASEESIVGHPDASKAHLEATFALAHLLGAKYVRTPAPLRSAGGERDYQRLLQHLKGVVKLAKENDVTLLLENKPGTYADTSQAHGQLLQAVNSPHLRAALNPANLVRMGEHPCYGVVRSGPVKRFLDQLYVVDATFKGDAYVLPGRGNAELRESISDLRCRSFSGFLCLRPSLGGGVRAFREAAKAFWTILDSL